MAKFWLFSSEYWLFFRSFDFFSVTLIFLWRFDFRRFWPFLGRLDLFSEKIMFFFRRFDPLFWEFWPVFYVLIYFLGFDIFFLGENNVFWSFDLENNFIFSKVFFCGFSFSSEKFIFCGIYLPPISKKLSMSYSWAVTPET